VRSGSPWHNAANGNASKPSQRTLNALSLRGAEQFAANWSSIAS
jgi:hypothetical protein